MYVFVVIAVVIVVNVSVVAHNGLIPFNEETKNYLRNKNNTAEITIRIKQSNTISVGSLVQ